MKKLLAGLLVLCLIGAAAGGAYLYITGRPEYALHETAEDIKEDGLAGLQDHLTGEAGEKVDRIVKLAENPYIVGAIGAIKMIAPEEKVDETVQMVKEGLENVEWEIKDVMTGNDNAEVLLGFCYDYGDELEQIAGTVKLSMQREDGEWKINGIDDPKIFREKKPAEETK